MEDLKKVAMLTVLAAVLAAVAFGGLYVWQGFREIEREEAEREFQHDLKQSQEPTRRALEDAKIGLWQACKENYNRGGAKSLDETCRESLTHPPQGIEPIQL